jgi:hypothetical protein
MQNSIEDLPMSGSNRCVVHLQDKVTPSTKALWPGASFKNRSYWDRSSLFWIREDTSADDEGIVACRVISKQILLSTNTVAICFGYAKTLQLSSWWQTDEQDISKFINFQSLRVRRLRLTLDKHGTKSLIIPCKKSSLLRNRYRNRGTATINTEQFSQFYSMITIK